MYWFREMDYISEPGRMLRLRMLRSPTISARPGNWGLYWVHTRDWNTASTFLWERQIGWPLNRLNILLAGSSNHRKGETSTSYRKGRWEQGCQRIFLRKPKHFTFQHPPNSARGELEYPGTIVVCKFVNHHFPHLRGWRPKCVYSTFDPQKRHERFQGTNCHRANSLQWTCNSGTLTRCSVTPPRQRSLSICVVGPSWKDNQKEQVTSTFPHHTELELPALGEHIIGTQGFPFMIHLSFKIKLSSIFLLCLSCLVSCFINFF